MTWKYMKMYAPHSELDIIEWNLNGSSRFPKLY